ncbi:hypothetical protein, partial [Methylobacterium sp. WL19]|uniref:hypothetical protein n=1 Tax=Methylobacterium sp. WL19 TaxID=2603896 RepID=UPI001AEDBE91
LLEALHRTVNAKIAKLIDFRDKHMTPQHNSLPANKDFALREPRTRSPLRDKPRAKARPT